MRVSATSDGIALTDDLVAAADPADAADPTDDAPEVRPTARAARRAATRAAGADRVALRPASGSGLGLAVLWLSLLVLLPLAAVVVKGVGLGWSGFWHALSAREAVSALVLTVSCALAVAVVNAIMGTLVAWVLVRDRFWGRRLVETVIDIPFALPTIVAGLVLLTLYGQTSPVGLHWYATRQGILVALLFVTLPFVVRSVQPVLEQLDREAEQAAASLGAGPVTVFRRIVLPAILPAIASGAALAFARAMGEYGSVVLISGNLENKTEIASMYLYKQIQNYDPASAAAVATALLVISAAVLVVLHSLHRWAGRRG